MGCVDQHDASNEYPLLHLDVSSSVWVTIEELKKQTIQRLKDDLNAYEWHKAINMDRDIYSGVSDGHIPLKN